MLPGDSADLRKQRGAFFTPYPIADYLARWALAGAGDERTILDPTSGEGVFLLAAAKRSAGRARLYGVDLHRDSLDEANRLLHAAGSKGHQMLQGNFFDEVPPDQLGGRIPFVDAVVGNPPFVRYQEHRGEARKKASAAALRQGVRLSGLASSWAPMLVHAASFLKPQGRLAMVVPSELLSVGYAEPIRAWLRRRFSSVRLVLFNRLQFSDAEEQVVLLIAEGTGGCEAFTLLEVAHANDLESLHPFDANAFVPQPSGKWTDLLVGDRARTLLKSVAADSFITLGELGRVELGTVTGANKFFTLSEATRREYDLQPAKHVVKTVPPGSRNLSGLSFTEAQWEDLKISGERVWMLSPSSENPTGQGFLRYKRLGEDLGVTLGYKVSLRGKAWWRPPVQEPPDLFFTYMNHITPRLVANAAHVTCVNSLHGVRLNGPSELLVDALPLLLLNTFTQLSAELIGRSYGGGILKLEPREAAALPVPTDEHLQTAWAHLQSERLGLNELVRNKDFETVTQRVDEALLRNTLKIPNSDIQELRRELRRQRARRQGRELTHAGDG